MSTIAKFKQLKDLKLDRITSWCLYQVDYSDFCIPSGDFTKKLSFDTYNQLFKNEQLITKYCQTDTLFVALNWGNGGVQIPDWQQYHYCPSEPSMKDSYKNIHFIPKMTKGTILEGAYMTDILKFYPESDSSKISTRLLKNNPVLAEKSIKDFQTELDILQPKVIIFVSKKTLSIFNYAVKQGLITPPKSLIYCDYIHHYAQCNYQRVIENRQKLETIGTQIYKKTPSIDVLPIYTWWKENYPKSFKNY